MSVIQSRLSTSNGVFEQSHVYFAKHQAGLPGVDDALGFVMIAEIAKELIRDDSLWRVVVPFVEDKHAALHQSGMNLFQNEASGLIKIHVQVNEGKDQGFILFQNFR